MIKVHAKMSFHIKLHYTVVHVNEHTKSNPTLLTQKHGNRGNIKHFKEHEDSELKNRENFLNELFFLHLYSLTLFFLSHFDLNSHVSFYTYFQRFSLIPGYEHQGMKQNKARRSGISNQ